MLSAIAIIPSPPVIVPELANGAAAELSGLRDAMIAAAAELPDRWVAIGGAPSDGVFGPDSVGTMAGYGVDVRVALAAGSTAVATRLPLCALITGWLRGLANPEARAEVRTYAADLDAADAAARGRRLRAEIDADPTAIGVLVVADGANTLTAGAPGGFDPDSVPVQAALDDALTAGDLAEMVDLSATVVGRVAYQVLAGLVEPAPAATTELFRGAPYGVGYYVGVWRP